MRMPPTCRPVWLVWPTSSPAASGSTNCLRGWPPSRRTPSPAPRAPGSRSCASSGAEHRVEALAASAPVRPEIDEIQYVTVQEGPCITAALERRTVRSGSLGGEKMWPRFGPRVGRLGVHSALSLPLLLPDQVIGAINVYAHGKDVFDEHAAQLGELFAAPAAVAVHNAQVLAQAQTLAAQLQKALCTRPVIDQAIGLLRGRTGANRRGGVRPAARDQPERARQAGRRRAAHRRRGGSPRAGAAQRILTTAAYDCRAEYVGRSGATRARPDSRLELCTRASRLCCARPLGPPESALGSASAEHWSSWRSPRPWPPTSPSCPKRSTRQTPTSPSRFASWWQMSGWPCVPTWGLTVIGGSRHDPAGPHRDGGLCAAGDIVSSLLIALSEDAQRRLTPRRDPLRGQARCVRRPRGRPVAG